MIVKSPKMMIVTLTALSILLSGCQTTDNSQQSSSNEGAKIIGTLIGAGLGALLGSKFGGGKGQLAAVAIGALVGGYLAKTIFEKLNQQDKQINPIITPPALWPIIQDQSTVSVIFPIVYTEIQL